jgi:hypothetical protein
MLVIIDAHCASPSGDANSDKSHVPFVSKYGTVRSELFVCTASRTSMASAAHDARRISAPLLTRALVLVVNSFVVPATS